MDHSSKGAGKMKPGTLQGAMPKAKKTKKLHAKKGVGKASGKNLSDKAFDKDKKKIDKLVDQPNAKFFMC